MAEYVARPADGCVWVTGASSGIGHAVSLKLARKGWTVIATARKEVDLNALADEPIGGDGRILARPGDTTDEARMREIVEEVDADHGGICLALLNAGVYLPVAGNHLDLIDFHRSFRVNLDGTVNALGPVLDHMKGKGRGQIAITSSVAGYGGLPTSAAYGATKAALTNMAESLKFDLDKMGIRIQIIHPGFVDTPATKNNPFPMPMLMPVDKASDRLIAGLERARGFEITFPRGFTYTLKFLNLLPYPLYFAAVNRFTGWAKRPLDEDEKPTDSD